MTGGATFVLVGHCWADRLGLQSAVRRAVPDARVVKANDERSLRKHLDRDASAVLLVNRVLEGRFADAGGVELIGRLVADRGATAMLVSNHADAQARAVEAGGWTGFGKSRLLEASTAARLAEAAGLREPGGEA